MIHMLSDLLTTAMFALLAIRQFKLRKRIDDLEEAFFSKDQTDDLPFSDIPEEFQAESDDPEDIDEIQKKEQESARGFFS